MKYIKFKSIYSTTYVGYEGHIPEYNRWPSHLTFGHSQSSVKFIILYKKDLGYVYKERSVVFISTQHVPQ